MKPIMNQVTAFTPRRTLRTGLANVRVIPVIRILKLKKKGLQTKEIQKMPVRLSQC